jgi:hypothetical protein
MSILKTIYDRSPVCIQNLLCSIKGYLICQQRYNHNFYRYLEKFKNGEYDPSNCLKIFIKNIANTPFCSA